MVSALLVCAGLLSAQGAPPAPADDLAARFTRDVRPILESHCFKCHGPQKKKGDLDFSKVTLRDRRAWKKALLQVEEREMPPEGENPLSSEQREALLRRTPAPRCSGASTAASTSPRSAT